MEEFDWTRDFECDCDPAIADSRCGKQTPPVPSHLSPLRPAAGAWSREGFRESGRNSGVRERACRATGRFCREPRRIETQLGECPLGARRPHLMRE
jgi:hypothetical protein